MDRSESLSPRLWESGGGIYECRAAVFQGVQPCCRWPGQSRGACPSTKTSHRPGLGGTGLQVVQTITLVRWETLGEPHTVQLSSWHLPGGGQCTEVTSLGRGGGDGGSGLLAQLEFVGQTIGTDELCEGVPWTVAWRFSEPGAGVCPSRQNSMRLSTGHLWEEAWAGVLEVGGRRGTQRRPRSKPARPVVVCSGF